MEPSHVLQLAGKESVCTPRGSPSRVEEPLLVPRLWEAVGDGEKEKKKKKKRKGPFSQAIMQHHSNSSRGAGLTVQLFVGERYTSCIGFLLFPFLITSVL
jgi:hypothetical protein